jgi:methionine biosynthesis protein MetW
MSQGSTINAAATPHPHPHPHPAPARPMLRPDLARIASWIEPGSRVLDLGCGDGELLAWLRDERQVRGAGVEIDDHYVIACVRRGVDVIQQNLEDGLALFDAGQFDTVVLSQTLQSMHRTEHILHEMARVARYGVVSFPNFGYWPHGFSILRGRMPVTGQMPYEWYNTPNIHLCTLRDFEALAAKLGLRILQRATFNDDREVRLLPSWRSTLAVYRFAAG